VCRELHDLIYNKLIQKVKLRKMKRSTQKEMIERRTEMLNHYSTSMKPSEWVPLVASKYGISEDAVKKDWGNRRKWIQNFSKINDSKQLASEMLQDYEVSILDAYHLYEEAEDVKTKIQTMWLRLKIMKEKKDFLEEVNALEYIKVDFSNQGNEHDIETDPNPMRRVLGY
jgi:hypothetical protein